MREFLQQNIDITNLSNYKTPATARWFFEVLWEEDIEKLYKVASWARKEKLKVLWISSGTNMLFAFDQYEWVVIKNSLKWWEYNEKTKNLETYGAESIWDISVSLERELWQDLWHRFIGLPGSIAGAIYWNAGCFGLETENNFQSCRVLDLNNGQVSTIEKKDMNFEYRSSLLKSEKKYFLISAVFDLSEKIEKYHSGVDNIDFRENKQPKGNSCGSFFKNPNREQSAGYLIEQVWLKGHKIWGAYFSDKHANFLMHDGQGGYKDMLELISLAQERVKNAYAIGLENEVQIITN
jgi:UDP-N-acetylmuramate dehydrogenase